MWDINQKQVHELHRSSGLSRELVLLWSMEGGGEELVTQN